MTLSWLMEERGPEPRLFLHLRPLFLFPGKRPLHVAYDHRGFEGGQVIQSLVGYVRGVGLYPKSPEKSLKDFKWESKMNRFLFMEELSGCSGENGL